MGLFYYLYVMENRTTPENILNLEKFQVFVFGSNLNGWHEAGAAELAFKKEWAMYSRGIGLYSKNREHFSYAIPTKGLYMEVLPIEWVKYFVGYFIQESQSLHYKKLTFLVTEIGCGLAGYTPKEIAPLFKEAIKYNNIHLPQRFWNILNK